LDPTILQAIPGLHAFTCKDFIASFMTKGKQRSHDIIVKHEQFISAFAMPGEHKKLHDETFLIIEHFVWKTQHAQCLYCRCVMFHTYASRERIMLHLYGKILYDQIQLASYVANQSIMIGSWSMEGTQSTGLVVIRCHGISPRSSI